jgi:hypothetical protein
MNHAVTDYNADRSPKVAGRYTDEMDLEKIERAAARCRASQLECCRLCEEVPALIARIRELEEVGHSCNQMFDCPVYSEMKRLTS